MKIALPSPYNETAVYQKADSWVFLSLSVITSERISGEQSNRPFSTSFGFMTLVRNSRLEENFENSENSATNDIMSLTYPLVKGLKKICRSIVNT